MSNGRTIYRFLTFLAAYICLSAILACHRGDSQGAKLISTADSIIDVEYDTLYTSPLKAIKKLREYQATATDSTQYYTLDLYISLGYLQCGDDRTMDSIRRGIIAYCNRAPESKDVDVLTSRYWNHSAVYLLQVDKDSAMTCFKNSYKLRLKSGVMSGAIPVCINMADAYRQMGDMPRASSCYHRALALSDSLQVYDELLGIYTGLGQVYSDIENYREANSFFSKAEKLIESDSNKISDYSNIYFHVSYGNNLYFQKRYKDALRQFLKADTLAQMFGGKSTRFITQVNIGEVYLLMNQTDSARKYLMNSVELSSNNRNPANRFYLNSLLGSLYLRLHDTKTAYRYLKMASSDSLAASPQYLALHYERLKDYYTSAKDYHNAYRCLVNARHYRDSISSSAIRNQIDEMSYRYSQDTTRLRANNIIRQKNDQIEHMQDQIYISIIIAALVVLLAITFILFRRHRLTIKEIELRSMIYTQRLANIRNRISPHFVFNVLNRELDPDKPGLSNFVKLLRMNLSLCDRYIVSLAEEIEFVDAYIEDELPSLGKDIFEYRKHFGEGVDPTQIKIPSMFVHIFVENAVKHGLRGYPKQKYLQISVVRLASAVCITIENNGNTMSHVNYADSTGTGMTVVTQTIQILNDHNRHKKISLDIQSSDKGSSIWRVSITIPDGYNFYPFHHSVANDIHYQ